MFLRMFNGRNHKALAEWVKATNNSYQFTPDMPELELNHSCLLFLCNEMQTGHKYHHIISGGKDNHCVAPAFTHEPFIFMKRYAGENTFPIITRMAKPWTGWQKLSVRGELWTVPATTIRDLDNYHQQGTFNGTEPPEWRRIKVYVKIPFKKEDRARQFTVSAGAKPEMAWTYLGTDVWAERQNDHDFGKIAQYQPHQYIPKIERYFWFTTEECTT